MEGEASFEGEEGEEVSDMHGKGFGHLLCGSEVFVGECSDGVRGGGNNDIMELYHSSDSHCPPK